MPDKRMLPGKSCPDWNEETRRRRAIMNEIEKRELIEQQRKILEAGTQRERPDHDGSQLGR